MTIAVDTNVLLDIQTEDELFYGRSAAALERAAMEGPLIVGEVVYAELATRNTGVQLDFLLADLGIAYQPSTLEALSQAGAVYGQYTRERGAEVQCPNCGRQFTATCPACGASVLWRQHLIPDFLVGAHAQVLAGTLLTRDRGVFRRFFPGLARYD
jgi:predicted nucleic acid-binding protein